MTRNWARAEGVHCKMAGNEPASAQPRRAAGKPTIAKWRLGRRLRELRTKADISIADAAKRAGINEGTVSKIEQGKQACKTAYLELWLLVYGASDDERAELRDLAREAATPGWWSSYGKKIQEWFRQAVAYESEATSILIFEMMFPPGLLQTAAYSRAIVMLGSPSEDELERAVDLRLRRQQVLFDSDPPNVHAILDQAALMRRAGSNEVMVEQIDHLIAMGKLPHVTIQVLPFEVGIHPSMTSPFMILGFEPEPGMDTVYMESGRSSVYLDTPADRSQYSDKFNALRHMSLSPEETADWLSNLRSQYL